jgi:cytochrome c nitrite reductase small subunit
MPQPPTPETAGASNRVRWRWLWLAALLGGLLSLGAYTFVYAQGQSYLLDDPKGCANCHVMQDVYDSWNRSRHHGVAVCNDCHTPHTFLEKYAIKGINGINHSMHFTLDDYPVNIQITGLNARVARDNCIRCHQPLVGNIRTLAGHADANIVEMLTDAHGKDVDCLRCHHDVGH